MAVAIFPIIKKGKELESCGFHRYLSKWVLYKSINKYLKFLKFQGLAFMNLSKNSSGVFQVS